MDKKRNIWKDSEVKVMLEIIKEKHILQLMDGKTRRNKTIFIEIEKEMRNKGFDRNADQIRSNFKFLKSEYNSVKRNNNKSGAERKTCLFFEILEELLSSRPAVKFSGVDTASSSSVDENITIQENDDIMHIDDNVDVVINEESASSIQMPTTSTTCENDTQQPKTEKYHKTFKSSSKCVN